MSKNGKQSHCCHRGASKHIFIWDAEKEASDPPFFSSASFQHIPAPQPSCWGREIWGFLPFHPLLKAIWASDLPVHHPVCK